MLVALDNFEHLIAAADFVSAVLAAAPPLLQTAADLFYISGNGWCYSWIF
jgi:hypothetical protein